MACLEEIAYRQSWITRAQVKDLAAKLGKSSYGQYLRQMLEHEST
jgi:glucose-1-phosphate thymidylyltransferase